MSLNFLMTLRMHRVGINSLTCFHRLRKNKLNMPKNWEFGIGMERFIASHTSYEFGMNTPPWTKPLSRLEFPVNTWWLNFDARRTCPRWSAGGRAGFSVNRNSNKMMIDSDWETNDNDEDVLFNYAKLGCDVREAFLFKGDVDVNKLARIFNGGGHPNASGCVIKGSIAQAIKIILPKAKTFLKT